MISLLTFRNELNIEDEKRLSSLRKAVLALWSKHTNRIWDFEIDRSKTFRVRDPYNVKILRLDLYPVLSLTSITKSAYSAGTKTNTTVSITGNDFLLDSDMGTVELINGTWATVNTIVWTGGYKSDTVSGDIVDACIAQAKFMLSRLDSKHIAMSSEGFQSGSTTFLDPTLHPTFKLVAGSHKLW